MKKRHPKGKGCWYYQSFWTCVLCGKGREYRERRWGKRPKRAQDRCEFHETACGSHFL